MISLLTVQLYHISQIIIWIKISSYFPDRISFYKIIKIYFFNNLYSYLPNRLFYFGSTLISGKLYGIKYLHLTMLIFMFQIGLVLSGIFLIVPIFNEFDLLKNYKIYLVLFLFLFLTLPILMPFILKLKKNNISENIFYIKLLKPKIFYFTILTSAVSWFLFVKYFLIFKALDNVYEIDFYFLIVLRF